MTYEKFMEQVKEQIMSFLPEEYANADVTIQEVSKNNNQKFHAICIKRPEDRIVPNVYLEDYYRTYEDDGNMENILTAIAGIYQKNMENNENLLPFEVKDYESVKNRLYVVALNRNNNQDYLRDAVRRDITETDITSVVRVLCTNNQEKGMSSFMVKSGMLEMWGISREEIYEQALKNTERIFKPDMRNMKEILLSGCMGTLSEEEQEGFRSFLNLDIPEQDQRAEKSKEISSIHEVILMKDNGDMNAEELQRMVMEINRTQVAPEEVLSDEVYSYDYRQQKLTMATSPIQTKELLDQITGMCDHGDFMEEEQEADLCMGE